MSFVSRYLDTEKTGEGVVVTVRVTALRLFKGVDKAEKKAKAAALFRVGIIDMNKESLLDRVENLDERVEVLDHEVVAERREGAGIEQVDFKVLVR